MKHINRLWHTNRTCNRDCADTNGSPVLADTLIVVTLMTSATNGNMFFRREDLWFHTCLGLKWEQLNHTYKVTLADFALGRGAACVLSCKYILAFVLQLRKIIENMSGYLRSIGTVRCFNFATLLQATSTGLLVSSHSQISCQCDFTYSSFKMMWEEG